MMRAVVSCWRLRAAARLVLARRAVNGEPSEPEKPEKPEKPRHGSRRETA